MNLSVYYNDSNIDLSLPDNRQVDVFDHPPGRLYSLKEAVSESACAEIREFVLSSQALIVINDAFRPTPSASLLGHIFLPEDFKELKLLIATGAHPPPDKDMLRLLTGRKVLSEASVQVHSAFDDAEHVSLGSDHGSVALNRHLVESSAIFITGSVEPHYFAGFTGGRKIILPGCASFGDIQQNHALAVSEDAQPLKRNGNPVWLDIVKRSRVVDDKDRMALQVVCDNRGSLFGAFPGDWDESYQQACNLAKTIFSREASQPFDIVICVVYPPLDRNFYQLQKSFENVATAAKEGGTILLISACSEGIGDRHFIDLARSFDEGTELNKAGNGGIGLMGIHKVRRTRRLAERLDLILFSELKQADIEPLPIKVTHDVNSTIEDLMDKYGPSSRVAVVLDSGSQVLYSGDSVRSNLTN